MYKSGFVKVSAATPKIMVGNIEHNIKEINYILNETTSSVVVFPELCLTGYSASDLFYQEDFLKESLEGLKQLLKQTTYKGLYVIGMPLDIKGVLYNCAVVIQKDKILGVVPKHYLPNNQEFYEKRWFKSGKHLKFKQFTLLDQKVAFGDIIFEEKNGEIRIGVEICQDMWAIHTPSDDLAIASANIILNLSASTEYVGKKEVRKRAVLDHSRKQMGAYVYTTCGPFESVSDTIFSNHKVIASMGELLSESAILSFDRNYIEADISVRTINYQRRQDSVYRDNHLRTTVEYQKVKFSLEQTKTYNFANHLNPYPFVQKDHLGEAADLQMYALAQKLESLPKGSKNIIIGVSGGLDSTLALLAATKTVERFKLSDVKIFAVTMPADVTSERTYNQANKLMQDLDVIKLEYPIQALVDKHLNDIDHHQKDVTFENAQARMRTLILMDLANKHQGFVLGTGDLSEIALGFMTYNGDHMSMYAINSGVPKTLVSALVEYYAKNYYPKLKDNLKQIILTPISPELVLNQVTENEIGRYDINDFILYHHIYGGFDEADLKWLVESVFKINKEESTDVVNHFFKRFYTQQFKRQTMPEGPKILSINLSPRGSYRMPSDVKKKVKL